MGEETNIEETVEKKEPKVILDIWDLIPPANKTYSPTKKIEFQKPVHPDDKALGTILNPLTGDDDLRPVMSCVYFSEKGLVATDAHRLGFIPEINKKFNKDKIFCLKDVKEMKKYNISDYKVSEHPLKAKYPNYEAVVPIEFTFVHEVDYRKLKVWSQAIIKTDLVNKITFQKQLAYGNDFIIGVNVKFLSDVCDFMLRNGIEIGQAGLSKHNRAIIFTDKDVLEPNKKNTKLFKNVFVLLMPVMLSEGIGVGTDNITLVEHYSTRPQTIDFEFDNANIYYDLRDNTVRTWGIETPNTVDLNLTSDSIPNQGNITPDDIRAFKKIQKKGKNALPILDYCFVTNGTFWASDLENSIFIDDCGLSDGIYEIVGDGIIKRGIDVSEESYYPDQIPIGILEKRNEIISSGAKGSASYQEFSQKIKIASEFASNDDLRPAIQCVWIKKNQDNFDIWASDGNIIYRDKLFYGEFNSEVSLKFMPNKISPALDNFNCEWINIYANQIEIVLKCGQLRSLMTKMPDVKDIPFEMITSGHNFVNQIEFNAQKFIDLIREKAGKIVVQERHKQKEKRKQFWVRLEVMKKWINVSVADGDDFIKDLKPLDINDDYNEKTVEHKNPYGIFLLEANIKRKRDLRFNYDLIDNVLSYMKGNKVYMEYDWERLIKNEQGDKSAMLVRFTSFSGEQPDPFVEKKEKPSVTFSKKSDKGDIGKMKAKMKMIRNRLKFNVAS